MATYSSYRHIELDKVGAGKKRVLKPPGGGSHDLFSPEPEKTAPSTPPRRLSAQNSSIIFSDEADSSPVVNGSGGKRASCNERLFGPLVDMQTPKGKANGQMMTNGKEDVMDGVVNETPNGKAEAPMVNGSGSDKKPVVNSAEKPAGKQRVPPGGYSSGLW